MGKCTGKRLDGRYEIHKSIGVGGMTPVYRAYGQVSDRTVAIKVSKGEFLRNENFIRRLKNESKAVVVLSHPNIVKIYDVNFGGQIQYIVMECIDGITLRGYLNQQKEIKWKEAIRFTVQILRALQHAYKKGIIHHDIKPQNIIPLQDGTIKVTGFGIACFSRNEMHTVTDKAIDSVHYIVPERARGNLTDEKADVYSVDVVSYEVITGQFPFEADNAVSVAVMQLQADPRPPKNISPAIPDGLEEVTLKAIQKDPSRRYQSMTRMLRDIEQFHRNPSISFQYKCFINEKPTRYADAINTVCGTEMANYNDNYAYEEEYSRGEKKKKSAVALVISGVLTAFLLVAVAFGIIALTRSCGTQEVEDVDLPNFVGQELSDIQADEKYEEFQFKIEYAEDSSKGPGIVLDQNPKGTKEVKANAEITLTVNDESQTATVPPVKRLTQMEAEEKLGALNLQCKIHQVEDDQTAAGYVKDVVPAEGSEIAWSGTVVELCVSKGPSSTEVSVPSVIGKNLDATEADILAVGLTVDTEITCVDDDDKAEDVMIETSPLLDVKAAKGTPVRISVSSGKKSEEAIDIYVQLPSRVTHDIALKTYLGGILCSGKTANPSYSSVYQMGFKGASDQKTLIARLGDQRYNMFLLDFDTSTPRQTESCTYQKPEGSSANGITRAS